MDDESAAKLLAYIDALLEDPDHAELDASELPGNLRQLGERLSYLGSCVQEGRVFAEDLARGNLEAISSQYTNHANPLIPSLEDVRKSLAQLLSLGTSIVEADKTAQLEGQGEYVAMLNRMVVEVKRRHTELEHSANTDPLTGVGNRRLHERTMEALWEKGEPFTVAFIDIDHLKRCNDHYGHEEGNRYILQTSLMLKLRRKRGEELFRIGGDEFVYVSETDSEHELAKRLEQCREQLIAQSRQEGRMVYSFSYGCSHVDPKAGDDSHQMVTDADKKMYRYKLTHRVAPSQGEAAEDKPGIDIDERIFEALAMASVDRYFFVCDIDNDESLWSNNAIRDFNLPSSHMSHAGDIWLGRIHPDDRQGYEDEISRLLAGKTHHHAMRYRALDARGQYAICECRGYRLDAEEGKPALFVGTIVNRSIAENIDPATGLGDIHGLVISVGRARHLQRPTGIIGIKVVGLSQINATHGYETGDQVLAAIAERIVSATRGRMTAFRSRGTQFVLIGKDLSEQDTWELYHLVRNVMKAPFNIGGETFSLESGVAWVHYDEVPSQPFSILSGLSRRVRSSLREGVAALPAPTTTNDEYVNSLTGLRSGSSLLRLASRHNASTPAGIHCLVSIDLGNMRLFNEWYGHDAGDALLAEVGQLLAKIEDEGSALAGYWGQDDFCLYAPFDRVLIDDIYGRMRQVVARRDDSAGFSPSFGVLPLDHHHEVTIDDYSRAMFANKESKGDFKNRISLFEPLSYEQKSQEHRLLSSFQYAISDGGIYFVLQPQCDLTSGKVVGAEALVRWAKKDGERIPPAEFIPMLERNGFIVTLDKRIWTLVARWLHDAIERGLVPVPVSINVSRVDILAFDVPDFLGRLLAEFGLAPRLLEVEITETAYMQDQEMMSEVVGRLRAMGMTVLMDDFGTGHSSLSMLGGVNVDVIKLDRQFLPTAGMTQGRVDRGESILASMVGMAHALDLPMIVEGVETREQAGLVGDLGARYVQGFWCYRPMPVQEFEEILADPDLVDLDGLVSPSERGVYTPPRATKDSGRA